MRETRKRETCYPKAFELFKEGYDEAMYKKFL